MSNKNRNKITTYNYKKHSYSNMLLVITITFSILALSTIEYIAPDISAFSQDNHNNVITPTALSFLKQDVLDDITEEQSDIDFYGFASSEYHFDGCIFQNSTETINDNYGETLGYLDPNSFDLFNSVEKFTRVLHPVQDFYSHSNWAESNQKSIIDNGFGNWAVLEPFGTVNGMIVIQGENDDIPSNLSLTRNNDKTITVYNSTDDSTSLGLVSGTVIYAPDDCPNSIVIGHWDTYRGDLDPKDSDFGTGLNKDNDSRPMFADARDLAIEQTKHEWCRLVTMVENNYGQAGVDKLFDEWVADEGKALALCSNQKLDLVFLIDATGSMADDIAAVQASATDLIDAIQSESNVSTRFALATYKDFPISPYGDATDYPYKAEHVFTTDADSMKTAINAITVSGGADWPESVYSGLINTISGTGLGDWDNNANAKVIIMMGDAPPHDPEPFTGYTMSSVIDAANAGGIVISLTEDSIPNYDNGAEMFTSDLSKNELNKVINDNTLRDYTLTELGKTISSPILDNSQIIKSILSDTPINIYSIVIGNDADTISSFTQLATDTGGSTFTAENAGEVVPAITEALDVIFEEIIIPKIISLVADDPDDLDNTYSVNDIITITFDLNTNEPGGTGIQTKTSVDNLYSFTESLGETYAGQWTSANTFVITITNTDGASPPIINGTTVTPAGITPILSSDGTSEPSTVTSPILSGDFGLYVFEELFCGQLESYYNVISGTNSPDYLIGTNSPDLIFGNGGNDLIKAHGSNNCIYAGDGNDFVLTNDRGNTVYGGAGDDSIQLGSTGIAYGEDGDDIIFIFNPITGHLIDGGNGNDLCVPNVRQPTNTANCEITSP